MQELFWYDKKNCPHTPGWHYAHGAAENFLGHDIPVCPNDYVPKLGRSIVLLTNEKGESKKAACYSWYDGRLQRGLFVFLDDKKSILYAAKCMMEKRTYL